MDGVSTPPPILYAIPDCQQTLNPINLPAGRNGWWSICLADVNIGGGGGVACRTGCLGKEDEGEWSATYLSTFNNQLIARLNRQLIAPLSLRSPKTLVEP